MWSYRWFLGVLCIVLVVFPRPGPVAQVVEQFVFSSDTKFWYGKEPSIRGDFVVWQHQSYCWQPRPEQCGPIEAKNISRGNEKVLNVASYNPDVGWIVLGTEHLFWLRLSEKGVATGGFFAKRLSDLSLPEVNPFLVSDFGYVVAANSKYVFFRDSQYGPESNRFKIFAKPMDRLSDPDSGAIKVAATVRQDPSALRSWGTVSERYLFWIDRDPGVPEDSWKVHAKSMDDLFTPGTERVVLDTRFSELNNPAGPRFSASGSLLACMVDSRNEFFADWSIEMIDIERADGPILLDTVPYPDNLVVSPTISEDYVAWERIDPQFNHFIYAQRLVDHRPVNSPFFVAAGDWVNIDQNILVWNGGLKLGEAGQFSNAIMGAELELPGATDLGDVNHDGQVDLSDAIALLDYLFLGGWKPRLRLADVNQDGELDLSDTIYLLMHLYLGGTL
jgi:dockerin type I repeat protein